MFYFLSQGSTLSSPYSSPYLVKQPWAMTGIGIDKAFRIWFLATSKFDASTNYVDARAKTILAAQELYGVGEKEDVAVRRAYAAINVGADVDELVPLVLSITKNIPTSNMAVGDRIRLTAQAGGGVIPYSYKWYRNGTLIDGETGYYYDFTARLADNGAVYKATVTDNGRPMSTISYSTSCNIGAQVIVNGSFESGAYAWSGNTTAIGTFAGQTAQSGTKYAWLGGKGTAATTTLSQTVKIPATSNAASLTFGLHIDTAESGTTAYDTLAVIVTSGKGTKTLATYSNANAAPGYQIYRLSLDAFRDADRDQTVTVTFSATEDSSLKTSFVLDNVSVDFFVE